MNEQEVKKLYKALIGKGYEKKDIGDESTFAAKMSDEKNRRELYDYVQGRGDFRIGGYEDYERRITGDAAAPQVESGGLSVEGANPGVAAQQVTGYGSQVKGMAALREDAQRFNRAMEQGVEAAKERIGNMREYGSRLGGGQTVESGMRYNPQSGKLERTYLTPTGERTSNKAVAEAASREYRDAADMTVNGQLRRAIRERDEIVRRLAERSRELEEEFNDKSVLEKIAASMRHAESGYQGTITGTTEDDEYMKLQAALRQSNERIAELEKERERQSGDSPGFWRSFGKTMADPYTWLSAPAMSDAVAMVNARGGASEADDLLLQAAYGNQQAQQQYGGNAGFMERAGVMTGHMPSFMIDFVGTGMGFEGMNIAAKAAGKVATKTLSKEVIKEMTEQGFKSYVKKHGLKGLGQETANWTIKALGTTADDLLIRAPLMANTVQAGDTAADIAGRKLGEVTVDENGNYNFANDKTWGSAIWQGEANSIIENYSEMFGSHLPEVASLGNISKLANVIGAKRIGGMLARADAGAIGGITETTRRLFGQMGVSDYFGEVAEEYYGQLWRTMLNLDDAYQQNPDGTRTNLFLNGQFHGDIWGGMALSMGLIGAGKTAMSGANYLSLKHDVNKADRRAGELLTADVWDPLRETIDTATNDNIGEVADRIVGDSEFTEEEKAAVLDYMERSLYLRGANLAELAMSRGGVQDERVQTANECYMDGYNAETDEEMQDIRNLYDMQRERLLRTLPPEAVADIDNDPMEALQKLGEDEATNRAIIDYVNAKQGYDGMIERVRDDIDGRIAESDAMIESRVNGQTGMIQGATLKVQDENGNDRRVYVVSGNLVALEDGTGIDREKSDGSIVIRDAVSGEQEMVSPEAILSVEDAVDPETEKMAAAEAIRQEVSQAAVRRIEGKVTFQPGETYNVTDETGQTAQIQVAGNKDGIVDNGDGTVNVSTDGGQTIVAMRKDDIQTMVDAANRARVDAAARQVTGYGLEGYKVNPLSYGDSGKYGLNEEVMLRNDDGSVTAGVVVDDDYNDGTVLVQIDTPEGERVIPHTREELYSINAAARQVNGDGSEVKGDGTDGYELQPVGENRWGKVFQWTLGKAKEAAAFLRRMQGGYLRGVFHRDDIGDIDLAWGDEKGGLKHIIQKHIVEHDDFDSVEEAMQVIDDVVKNGEVTSQNNSAKIEKDGYRVALAKDENGSWIITAYDYLRDSKYKKRNSNSSLSSLYTTTDTQQGAAQGISAQAVSVPESKDTQSHSNMQQSAFERIPKDEQGQPLYEQTDAETAWDAIVEQTEGDEAMAQNVADAMVADKESELKKIEKAKPKGGVSIAEKIAAERERKAAVNAARQQVEIWKKIAGTANRRKQAVEAERRRAADEAAALRRAEEERLRAEREEAERIEREALNGVPDIVDDTPKDARARGYRRVNGHKIDRQEPIPASQGKEIAVKFSDNTIPSGHIAVIDASILQPSHIAGVRNPLHFIDEAQPKERIDDASVLSAQKIAGNIRPEEITSSVTAYTGAPTVNTRGEVIQGNNRSAALRNMWDGYKEQAEKYRQYLIEHAQDFGLTPEAIDNVEKPVLVNMLDVDDNTAITLGQYVAQDTESGGTERIKPKNALQRMGNDMRSFANLLLQSTDDDTSFAGLVDRNGDEVLKWMNQRGYITPTQYKSAFDSKGNITAEAKNDLRGIMYQSIFKDGSTRLEEMFNLMPAKAQKAILATAYRDYDSPGAERMIEEIQNSIRAYYALSHDSLFAEAKNWKDARTAVEDWKRQYQIDDATGESYLPAENYSNFALHLATMYKGESQGLIQGTFNKMYDLIQGRQEENLFEQPDNTPRTLAEAIKEVLNIDYNGQQRSNVLAGDSSASQRGQQGGNGDAAAGERDEVRNGTADSGTGVVPADTRQRGQRDLRHTDGRQPGNLEKAEERVRLSDEVDENGRPFVISENGTTDFGEIREDSGLTPAPIKLSEGYQDEDGKGYGLVHIEANHGEQIRKAGFKSVENFVYYVAENYDEDNIRVGKRRSNGSPTFLLQTTDTHDNTLFVEMSKDGSYWNVNSAGVFRKGYSNKKETVAKTEPQQPNNAVSTGSSLSENEEGGITSSEPNGKPTVSDSKDREKQRDNKVSEGKLSEKIAQAEEETNTNPTEPQKEAGNYRKGHVQVGTFDVTIENPRGSVRSGVDADGNKWSVTMNNSYGYIRGTEGVDGDHIDVFLSDNIDGWNGSRAFVIDQYNEDGTFDEHKVMLGFNDADEAQSAFASNYDREWAEKRKLVCTPVTIDEFEKWINSSHRKTKPFAEYKSVKKETEMPGNENKPDGYTVERRFHKKNGTYIHAVKFTEQMPRERFLELKKRVKDFGGYYSSFGKGGFIFDNEADADKFAQAVLDPTGEQLDDAAPVSITDLREITATKSESNVNQGTVDGNLFQYFTGSLSELISQARQSATKLVKKVIAPVSSRLKNDLAAKGVDVDDSYKHVIDNNAIRHALKKHGGQQEVKRGQIPLTYADFDRISDIVENYHTIDIENGKRNDINIRFSKSYEDGTTIYVEEKRDKRKELAMVTIWKTKNPALTDANRTETTQISDLSEVLENSASDNTMDTVGTVTGKQNDTATLQNTVSDNKDSDIPSKKQNPSGNKLVTDERYEELKRRMKAKLGQLNVGIDPEILAIGTEMAVYHIEKGARKFAEFAKSMIADIGDVVRPYLKSFYNGARDLPEVQEAGLADEMTPYDEVRTFDVANFDKAQGNALATAEMVVQEQELGRQAEESKEKITNQRNTQRKKQKNRNKSVPSQTQTANLFGSLFEKETETSKSEEDGLLRNDAAIRSERLPSDSDRHAGGRRGKGDNEEVREETGRLDGRRESGNGSSGSEIPQSDGRPDGRLQRLTVRKNTRNNHSERGIDHAPTSVDARIEANIKAIELAKRLIESDEAATSEQMTVLRKFSGWGGLGKAFTPSSYSWSSDAPPAKLRELLGEEAYQQAVMSANSAYYTPAYVVDTLWDIAEQMGFKGGNILEGSAGIGNILGQMPTSTSERSDIHAIEIDQTSGSILSLLYPDAKVDIQGFEQTRIPNGSVDLAITNVPFVTGLRVDDTTGDKDLSKKFHNIHDFCIAKNVRKLREGGIGIFITSNGTLDNSKKLRDWIVNEGGSDFVGAFRMNNRTFGGTAVTSDIIVIRKRVSGMKSPNAIDVSTISGERTAEFDTGETRKVKGQEEPVIRHLSMDYNRYFIEHPENMAGTMRFAFEDGDTFRPTSKGLYPIKGKDQRQMLSDFVNSFSGKDWTDDGIRSGNETTSDNGYVADATADGKKVGELYEKDGKLVIANADGYYPLEVNANKVRGHTKLECFKAYEAIKKALADVLDYQTNNESDKGLKPLLAILNKAYDDFVDTYGHFNKNTAISFLRNDVDYPNVFSLEKYEEIEETPGKRIAKFGKTDIFSKRVVEKEKEPSPTNIKDGVIASVFKYGFIDIPYIAGKLGMNHNEVNNAIVEGGYGFVDPTTRRMEARHVYLSGNVREKLHQAEENNEDGIYDDNIKALQEILPMDIPAHLIDFTLGSSWINPRLYEEYVKERTDIDVKFTSAGGTWFMNTPDYGLNKEKNRSMGVVSEMLHKTIFGHTLIEAAIQNRTITVSQTNRKWDGTTETITDKEATQACTAKIDEIRQDFKDWARQKMQSDPEMSATIERVYNDMFNNFVPMSIPDDFVPKYFAGASHKFTMRPHQGKAIVRGTMQPLMLAHEVGSGKTFTLISTAMEMRRLGTARKPMIVVQNATVGQFVASAKELYPNAKILTLEESDRSAEGRKRFYAKIRYNDWDMIVVPQSTFEFIPDSEERQMAFVKDKIQEKMAVLEQMKKADPTGRNMITRQAEREITQLEEELAGLTDEATKKRTANDQKKRAVARQNAEVRAKEMLDRRTDNVENFDDMGIDALLIDEAHEYKHLGFATAMQRGVKGVDPSYSKKSQGVYLKTQAVLEKSNGRNVVFATGTPISNTAAEIWTFMRYLMPADTMKEYGIYYFDDFVRNFGNIQQILEFTTSGKFKENNRFAGYVNLPELARIWSGVADTVRFEEIEEDRKKQGKPDLRPEIEGGKAQDIYLPQTRALRGIMKYAKGQLEEYDKMSGKEKKENSHIPLTMYGIAKAAAVDARLVEADAEDDPNSKTNEAVRQTLRSLKETADYKGTVAIFADNYQNKQSGFNVYEDILDKLIANGVPASQIVVMKSGMTVKKKLEIFDKVNRGDIRVILGSTFTLGTGVNIQERLHTLIHLDAPNRPMDYTQRNGRIRRQGNLHKEWGKPIRILRFGVEDSLDVTAYQRLKTKGAIADSIMNGKQLMNDSMSNRVLEEEEDTFGDTIAQLSGSEYAMLKNNAEKNVRKYESRKKQWEVDQTYIHNAKPKLKGLISASEKTLKEQRGYLETVKKAFPDGKFNEIIIGKHKFGSIDAMDDFFKGYNKDILDETKRMKEGGADVQTRQLSISLDGYTFNVQTVMEKEMSHGGGQLFTEVHRKMTYSCPVLGIDSVPVRQSLLRNAISDITENVITGKDFTEKAESAERALKHNQSELKQLESREGKPFEFGKELEQAKKQYQEYSELMKKEMEEKEAKYAALDAGIETADDISLTEEDDVLYRIDDELAEVNELFNEQLDGLTEENADSTILMLGRPSAALLATGIPDREIALYGNKLIKKAKLHKYSKQDVKDLPHYIANPIAVFKGSYKDGYAILTEMPINGKNALVSIDIRKGEVQDLNLITSVFDKNNKGVLAWINGGKLLYADKEKALDYLSSSAPIADATNNQELISAANIVRNFVNPNNSEDIVERDGEGGYTDDEVSYANDPRAKVMGKSSRTARQRREFAARERQRMAERVQGLAEKLHLDNVDIVTDASTLQGRRAMAKGFYSRNTGKITIVIPNHTSAADAEQTLLHEAVAHYGLRRLFGEHFDTFLDNVFQNADTEIRRQIVDMSRKHSWDFRTATEEYLASLAERTNFEDINASWWQKIKELFIQMLHKIGFEDFMGVTLSDNELRYILWRSYENFAEPGRYRSILGEAADVAKQYELKVGNAAAPQVNGYGLEVKRGNSDIAAQQVTGYGAEVKAERIEKLRRSEPVVISGEEIEPSDDLKQYKRNALEYGKRLQGSYTNKDTGRTIQLQRGRKNGGIKEVLQHDISNKAHIQSVAAIPHIIENAIYIDSAKNDNEDRNPNVSQYHYYVCGLNIGGEDYTVRMVEAEEKDGNRYYDHKLSHIEKGKLLNELAHINLSSSTGLSSTPGTGAEERNRPTNRGEIQAAPISDIKDKRLLSILQTKEEENDDLLYRDGGNENTLEKGSYVKTLARERYEGRVKRGMYQMQEALQDSMLGLREAMDAVLRGEGRKNVRIEDVAGYENAYLGENRLSSVNKAEADALGQLCFKPLLKAVAKLARTKAERDELTDYMMAKHGLERNRKMAERDAEKEYAATQEKHPYSKKTLQDFIDGYRKRDYAGLTALTGMEDVAEAEEEARRMVEEYEAAHDTAALWSRTRAMSGAILSKLYETGMMSKETYDTVRTMYEYYIPLRGFDEKTSAEAYAYLNSKDSAFNAPIKTAKGRKSKADDPFAYLQSMAESAIMQGNRNKLVKQRFLNFVLNHPSDLASVSDLWIEYDKVADEWKPKLPDNIDKNDTAEEVERKMQEFEERMRELAEAEPERYKHGAEAADIPYRVVSSKDLHQHQVVVKRGGRDYVITINGNPRAAQALNGQTNPDNDFSGKLGDLMQKYAGRVNRELSALYTTRNPDFVLSNTLRDMLYANTMVWVKESPAYSLRFHRNFAKMNHAYMIVLFDKLRRGKLNMSNPMEKMFQQFIMNGGETGYTDIRDIEKRKDKIRRELKKANGRLPVRKALGALGERFDEINRGVENCARFAAFVTSREMGRTVDRAIYDAKEISVNFNKKGAGAKFVGEHGQTVLGNVAGAASGFGRFGYVFWNAAIQGTTNFGRQVKRHPAKAFAGMASMFMLGAVIATMGGDDDEDKNAYYNLPEYVRRSNIMFKSGGEWISIPLPVEYRAVYGLGELMASTMSGKEHLTDAELADQIMGQVSQVLPLDLVNSGAFSAEGKDTRERLGSIIVSLMPTAFKPFAEVLANESWTGLPIYKDTPFNKNLPEWTKAYKSANRQLVGLAEALNEASGGNRYKKGWVDINPAVVEHLLEGYFGGVASTIDKMTKTAETIAGKREYDPRSIIWVNRVMKNGDERTEYRAVNNEYFRLKEEHDETGRLLRSYERDTREGIFDYAEKIDFLYNSPEYRRWEIFEYYRPDIDALQKVKKEYDLLGDEEAAKETEAELNELKKAMIEEMERTRR